MECDDRMSTWNEIQTKIAIISHWFCGYTFYIFSYTCRAKIHCWDYTCGCVWCAPDFVTYAASRFLDLFIFFTILSVGCFIFFFIFIIIMWFALAREISDALTIYKFVVVMASSSLGRSQPWRTKRERNEQHKNRHRVKNKKRLTAGAPPPPSRFRMYHIEERWESEKTGSSMMRLFGGSGGALTTGMYQGVFTQGLRAIHITWSIHTASAAAYMHRTAHSPYVHKNVYLFCYMCAVEMQIWNPRELFNKTAKIYERCSTGCPALMSLR